MIRFLRQRFFKKDTGYRANTLLLRETIAKSKRMKLTNQDMQYIVESLNSKLNRKEINELIRSTPADYKAPSENNSSLS
jgi:hypothetical protein